VTCLTGVHARQSRLTPYAGSQRSAFDVNSDEVADLLTDNDRTQLRPKHLCVNNVVAKGPSSRRPRGG